MARKLSEMAQARYASRKAEADSRRLLRSKMNPYNRLSAKPRSLAADFKFDPVKTINDIVFEMDQTINSPQTHYSSRSNLKLITVKNMNEDVRSYWKQRIAKGGIKFE